MRGPLHLLTCIRDAPVMRMAQERHGGGRARVRGPWLFLTYSHDELVMCMAPRRAHAATACMPPGLCAHACMGMMLLSALRAAMQQGLDGQECAGHPDGAQTGALTCRQGQTAP